MAMRFDVKNTTAGQPSWWLISSNGQTVAWAGETFDSTANAHRAANAFKTGAATARYDLYTDTGGHWRWRAWRSSDKVASSGESFNTHASAQQAADNVKNNAAQAEGPA